MNLSPARLLVDRCTPRDKFARTHTPLRKALCPSSDDSVMLSPPTSPWTTDFSSRRRAYSSSGSPGWRHLPTPIRPTFRPRDYELPPCPEDDDQSDTQTVSLMVLQRSLRNVEFDPACLDCLDQQLLLSPAESFSEVCYTEAVHDQTPVPVLQPLQPRIRKRTPLYDRTAMSEEDPYHDWDENMSVRWKDLPLPKPLPATPPPKMRSKDSAPRMSTQDSVLAVLESRLLLHNPDDSVHFFPVPSRRRSEDARKSSLDAPAPSISSSGSSSSSGTLKRLSHALSPRSRAKSHIP